MAEFTLEPRGPFTLASAARFVAGWPPGRGKVTERRDFLGVIGGPVEADNEARANRAGRTRGRTAARVSVLMRSA
jgi:hypothetical protein